MVRITSCVRAHHGLSIKKHPLHWKCSAPFTSQKEVVWAWSPASQLALGIREIHYFFLFHVLPINILELNFKGYLTDDIYGGEKKKSDYFLNALGAWTRVLNWVGVTDKVTVHTYNSWNYEVLDASACSYSKKITCLEQRQGDCYWHGNIYFQVKKYFSPSYQKKRVKRKQKRLGAQ